MISVHDNIIILPLFGTYTVYSYSAMDGYTLINLVNMSKQHSKATIAQTQNLDENSFVRKLYIRK